MFDSAYRLNKKDFTKGKEFSSQQVYDIVAHYAVVGEEITELFSSNRSTFPINWLLILKEDLLLEDLILLGDIERPNPQFPLRLFRYKGRGMFVELLFKQKRKRKQKKR
ncbi:MAG: hypothetical protein AAB649_01860 [Patescibacteria group bacterium]|mgnify:FL=1